MLHMSKYDDISGLFELLLFRLELTNFLTSLRYVEYNSSMSVYLMFPMIFC